MKELSNESEKPEKSEPIRRIENVRVDHWTMSELSSWLIKASVNWVLAALIWVFGRSMNATLSFWARSPNIKLKSPTYKLSYLQ